MSAVGTLNTIGTTTRASRAMPAPDVEISSSRPKGPPETEK